jgi:hypothetical protein
MFRLLKKKIVERIYFLLILAVPLSYGGAMLSSFFDKNLTVFVDNEIENSIEDNIPDTNADDIDQAEFPPLLAVDFIEVSLPFSYQNTPCFLVNSYSNICLQQKNPPP